MTKREQAQIIYNDLVSRGHDDRKMIVQRFQDALDMTPAGAATYYAACKKQHNIDNGITPAPAKAHKTTIKAGKPAKERSDSRQLYSVCTPNEDGDKVYSTSSHYSEAAALKHCQPYQVVVKGLPELDSDWSSLKPIK